MAEAARLSHMPPNQAQDGPVVPEWDAATKMTLSPPTSEPEDGEVTALRTAVRAHLAKQGFSVTRTGALQEIDDQKDHVRALHVEAVEAQRQRARPALARFEDRFLSTLIGGDQVEPQSIDPYLVYIDDRHSFNSLLWRWCSLHWSVPVSSGYGRRLRFLVIDRAHGDAVMGLIGLGDPVFALGCRDNVIRWDRQQRAERLSCVMDAFVLGAVPPYNQLLGGKLMALLAGSTEIQEIFRERYGHRKTLISERDPNSHLALITTSSALGRSSVYNRLNRRDGSLALTPVGFTGGTGDFHFSGEIYEQLAAFAKKYASDRPAHRHARWGNPGFRNRREAVQKGLDALGFDSRAMRNHGVKRQVFLNPLATNWKEFLRGEAGQLDLLPHNTVDALADWWRERWAVPRGESDKRWLTATPHQWRLYGSHAQETPGA